MNNFIKQIGINTYECQRCGTELQSGITGLANHWAECSGKEFMSDLILSHENKKLTVETVEQLKKKHMSVEDKLEELKKTFVKATKLVKELNHDGCEIQIHITNPTGATMKGEFTNYEADGSQVKFAITKASVVKDLMSEKEQGNNW